MLYWRTFRPAATRSIAAAARQVLLVRASSSSSSHPPPHSLPPQSPLPPPQDQNENDSGSSATSAPTPPDHRKIGREQELFFSSPYSPGSPIFLPHGATVFNRLVEFLRRMYVGQGFAEVITPVMYKTALWRLSGHLDHYAHDMFAVGRARLRDGRAPASLVSPPSSNGGPEGQPRGVRVRVDPDGDAHNDKPAKKDALRKHAMRDDAMRDDAMYGLKPMNCPGHCLLYGSRTRSWRELPLRLADFGALHRNEPSGALSGLTRTRCFHQDDGHVFCRPSQVEAEIGRALGLVRYVYQDALALSYSLVLSTRPADAAQTLGSDAEWARAEDTLARALDADQVEWTRRPGEGAFYGPKIDIVVRDSDLRLHQTATIQLDLQLPRRMGLRYVVPGPADQCEAEAEADTDGKGATPVLIHRAVLGSVERLMALLMEQYGRKGGQWPFWLNPRQVVVMTVNSSEPELAHARHVRDVLVGCQVGAPPPPPGAPQPRPTGLAVELDLAERPIGGKIRSAHSHQVGAIVVVGAREARDGTVVRDGRTKDPITPEDLLAELMKRVDSLK